MTTREKVFLGLCAAAAIGAAVYYALPAAGGKSSSLQSKPADFTALVTQVQVSLKQGALTAREEQLLAGAATQSLRDPLRARPLVSSANGAGEGIAMPKYTGFINTGPKPIAIIDGRDYRPGEPVLGGEFQLMKIFPDRVELRRRGATDSVRVPLDPAPVPAATR
jgi:hypothetical protein